MVASRIEDSFSLSTPLGSKEDAVVSLNAMR